MRASLIDTVTILCDLYGELTALSSCRLPEKWHASVPRDAPKPGPTYRVLNASGSYTSLARYEYQRLPFESETFMTI